MKTDRIPLNRLWRGGGGGMIFDTSSTFWEANKEMQEGNNTAKHNYRRSTNKQQPSAAPITGRLCSYYIHTKIVHCRTIRTLMCTTIVCLQCACSVFYLPSSFNICTFFMSSAHNHAGCRSLFWYCRRFSVFSALVRERRGRSICLLLL